MATPTNILSYPSSHFKSSKRKNSSPTGLLSDPPKDEDASFLSPHPPHLRDSDPEPHPPERTNGRLPAPPRSSPSRYVLILLFSFWSRPWPLLLTCLRRSLLLPLHICAKAYRSHLSCCACQICLPLAYASRLARARDLLCSLLEPLSTHSLFAGLLNSHVLLAPWCVAGCRSPLACPLVCGWLQVAPCCAAGCSSLLDFGFV
jgi:hypothetical protein